MKKIVALLIVTAMMLTLLVGCGQTAPVAEAPAAEAVEKTEASAEPIYVAFAYPLTGDLAQYGDQAYNGIMVKFDEVNAAGGINGRQIVVEKFDDKGEAKEAANLAQMISDDPKYMAVFGSYNSSCSMAAAPIYEKNKVVNFVPTAGHIDLPNFSYTFTLALGSVVEYQLFSKLAVEGCGAKRISLIYLNDDFGLEVLKSLTEWVPKYGGELISTDSYNEGQVRDFTPILTKIRQQDPDLVCINAGYADCSAMVIQAKQVGLDCPFLLGPSNYTDAFLEAAGDASEGHYVSTSFSVLDPDPAVQKFAAAYADRSGTAANNLSQQPYEAACMFVKALEEGATDRDSLYEILSGWDFWDGDTIKAPMVSRKPQRENLTLLQIKDGAFTVVG